MALPVNGAASENKATTEQYAPNPNFETPHAPRSGAIRQ
jgi:hypothetical protein